MSVTTQARPIIRWAGSKKRLLPEILRSAPKFSGQYIEPFAGSACVFFKLNPAAASLNDLNQDLIDFYITSSRFPHDVYECFSAFERNKERYYEIRLAQKITTSEVERAAQFLYLNRNCFNGIYRVNKKGLFNVPFSNSRVASYPSLEEFVSAASSLNRTNLRSMDFEAFCEETCEKDDFVYLDPPYYIPKVRIFREYNKTDFTGADTQRLLKLLERISAKGAKFLLSYPKGELTAGLAQQWYSREIKAIRSVAGSTDARRSEVEVLIANYEMG